MTITKNFWKNKSILSKLQQLRFRGKSVSNLGNENGIRKSHVLISAYNPKGTRSRQMKFYVGN